MDCKCPISVINKGFHNAKLQGPANDPKKKGEVLPLVSTYYSNYSNKDIVTQTNILLENCQEENIKNVFKDKRVVMAYKQPPNLLRRLTNARFQSQKRKYVKMGYLSAPIKRVSYVDYTSRSARRLSPQMVMNGI